MHISESVLDERKYQAAIIIQKWWGGYLCRKRRDSQMDDDTSVAQPIEIEDVDFLEPLCSAFSEELQAKRAIAKAKREAAS